MLAVTFRGGKPFAAYLYLTSSHKRDVSRSEESGEVVIDYDAAGAVMGIEIHSVTPQALVDLRAALQSHGFHDVTDAELQPLKAA